MPMYDYSCPACEAREAQEREAQDRANREADLALVTEQLGTLGAQYVLPAINDASIQRMPWRVHMNE